MKIALVTDGIWPYVLGGMQRHSFYLCKYLAKKQVEVDLIHFNKSTFDIEQLEFFTEEEKKYIHPVIIPMPKMPPFPGHYLLASYLHSKLIFNHLKEKLNTYDFIYTKGFTGWYLINQKHKGLVNCCKIGVKFHGYEMFQKQPDWITAMKSFIFLRQPVKQINLKADLVFSYGGKITEIIQKIGVKNQNIVELASGVEENQLTENITPAVPDQLRFLYLGRYERRKGIEELNESIKTVLKTNARPEFHFIGPIPESKKIIHPNVFYHGEIRDKAILTQKIKSCDVLICPSYSEGFPNVILEAMAGGLTVAATNVGAVELLVNSRTGWIIPSTTSEAIAKTLLTILKTNALEIQTKKENALKHIRQHFTWESLINKLLNSL